MISGTENVVQHSFESQVLFTMCNPFYCKIVYSLFWFFSEFSWCGSRSKGYAGVTFYAGATWPNPRIHYGKICEPLAPHYENAPYRTWLNCRRLLKCIHGAEESQAGWNLQRSVDKLSPSKMCVYYQNVSLAEPRDVEKGGGNQLSQSMASEEIQNSDTELCQSSRGGEDVTSASAFLFCPLPFLSRMLEMRFSLKTEGFLLKQ